MRVLLAVLLTFCVLLALTGRIALPTNRDSRAPSDVIETERRLASAVRERDHSALGQLVADDARIVDPNGALLNRTEWIAAARHGALPVAAAIRRPDVRVYDTIALVHGRARLGGADVYVLRIWATFDRTWRLVVEHTTDITEHARAEPPAFATLQEPIPTREIDAAPEASTDEEDVRQALRESHQSYWAKDVREYVRTIGSDLIRAAETGVRPGTELVEFMRHSPHLPRTPSDQLEMWARVFGSVAIGGWLDSGTTAHGASSRNRFTLALVWRDGRWQIVQIQSTGVSDSRQS